MDDTSERDIFKYICWILFTFNGGIFNYITILFGQLDRFSLELGALWSFVRRFSAYL